MSFDHNNPYTPPQEFEAESKASQNSSSDGTVSWLRLTFVLFCTGPIGLFALVWIFMFAFPTGMAITALILGEKNARKPVVYVCGSIFAWIVTLLAFYGMIRLAMFCAMRWGQSTTRMNTSRMRV